MSLPQGKDLPIEALIPFQPWKEFSTAITLGRNAWLQGEHVTIIGPTGSGKTTLAYYLLPYMPYQLVLATKPKSPSLSRFARDHHYTFLREWKDMNPKRAPKRIIWPTFRGDEDIANVRKVCYQTLNSAFHEGGWAVYLDELRYLTEYPPKGLGLAGMVHLYLLQGRELGISLMAGTQRPAWIPREFYTQATHLFFYQFQEDTDLRNISGIGGMNPDLIRAGVMKLRKYEFLYLNTRTGAMVRSRTPDPTK